MSITHPGDSRPPRAIASTPYDTAWVASVPHPHERRDPRFPNALNWISTHQLADGSWGSAIPYIHDRVICTLAALIPLARFGRRDHDLVQLRRGERFLWQSAHMMASQPCELVGFELLLPTLIHAATEAGINVPPHLDVFGEERDHKLALVPPHMIYSPRVTLTHSLEFLGPDVNPQQLLAARATNGSIGNSPAATAFLLHHIDDPEATAYVEQCLAGDDGAGVPVLEPCETYEALWTAYHRYLGGVPATQLFPEAFRAQLLADLASNGVGLSSSFPVPDADDTAIALFLLHEAGVAASADVLKQFEREQCFVSFPYERHASTGVNIHVLQALTRYTTYPGRQEAIEKILGFLREAQRYSSYWIDKWHISPYYATGRAIISLSEVARLDGHRHSGDTLLNGAVDWVLHTQNEDGSWGFYGQPTAEETAYAVLALQRSNRRSLSVARAVELGHAYVAEHHTDPRPAQWIDKCLYYPTRIVEAAIDAAIGSSEEIRNLHELNS